MLEGLRDFYRKCPAIEGLRINIDYLPKDTRSDGIEVSIDTAPGTKTIREYVDGSTLRQYNFAINNKNEYGADVVENIGNSGLLEDVSNWTDEQNKRMHRPVMPEGVEVVKVEAVSSAYLMFADTNTAQYQIQCRMVYYKE